MEKPINRDADLLDDGESSNDQHPFGGMWTRIKLEALEKYLAAFNTALSKQSFTRIYIDAFAGTGRCDIKVDGANEAIDGSARIALAVTPSFHKFCFIELQSRKLAALNALCREYPSKSIEVIPRDANSALKDLCSQYQWKSERAVLFLDPFGMQVEWSTLEAIAKTGAIDVWYLFPYSALYRQAPKNADALDADKAASPTRALGTDEWRQVFYVQNPQPDLFGDSNGDVRDTDHHQMLEFVSKRRHGLTETPVHRIYSEASLGKAYLKAMGIQPWQRQQPDFPPEMLGIIMSTYYGGRSEVHWRREAVPVLYCDFLSMYPTVCTLMGLWRTVIAEGIDSIDATDWVRDCLQSIETAHVQDADFWTALAVLVQVEPEADIFPVRAKYGQDASFTIGLNQLTSERPLWYTLADCIASKLLTGKAPRIVQALRFNPKAPQNGLRPVSIAGKPHYHVNPVTDDFYRRLIDLRRTVKDRVKTAPSDEREALDAEQLALKILANATSYGSFVEFNVEEQEECVTALCYGPSEPAFSVKVHQIEKPGTYFHPLLATLITGAARLMLAITERLAFDAGIDWAFCDTDSMALAKPAVMAYKDFLSRAQSVQRWFDPLNPYEQKGPLLKIEDANYRITAGRLTETLEPLYCWAVSSKRYALFNLDANGKPVLRKASAHGLGHLLPPYREHTAPLNIPSPLISLSDIGVERWQYDLWYRIVETGLKGMPDQVSLVGLPGLTTPAASRYAATTPMLLRWFKTYNEGKPYRQQVRPFNFLLAFQGQRLFAEPIPNDIPMLSDKPKLSRAKLPHLPRAVAPYSRDIETAAQCFDRSTGQIVLRGQLKTYGRALAQYHLHPEAKFLRGGYTDRGRTIRRHVYVTMITLIGKEANRWEEQFYLGMEAGAQVEYGIGGEDWGKMSNKLRLTAKSMGQKHLSAVIGISSRQLRDILNKNAVPSPRTQNDISRAAV